MKIFILIPYVNTGCARVNLKEVGIFESYSDAETHAHAMGIYYYDIIEK